MIKKCCYEKLNVVEVLISKAFDSYISHDEFVSANVLREYNKMKDIKNPETSVEYTTYYKSCVEKNARYWRDILIK